MTTKRRTGSSLARRITIKEQTNLIGELIMQCPKCGVDLVKGKTRKESDGTEGTEYKCPKCKRKFLDMKVPKDIFFGQDPT
jgi:DNA-directed RNA polymerase subunit RPC12/RpoP